MAMAPIHIVANPAAGQGKAPEFVEEHVVPILKALHRPYEVHTTKSPRDAGAIAVEILHTSKEDESITVVVAGGDGTAHELIEGVCHLAEGGKPSGRWELIILPLGTANALHASLFPSTRTSIPLPSEHSGLSSTLSTKSPKTLHSLSSLLVSLRKTAIPRRLPITLTSLLQFDGTPAEKAITSHIVLSTSLHAALLHDSESLRETYPGIDRFKVAAQQNLPIAFQAHATLHGQVLQYSPKAQGFVTPFTAQQSEKGVRLDGPFSYFTSVTLTDRLEPTFIIAPTLTTFPPSKQDRATIELIILRPDRDPVVRRAGTEEQKAEARGKRLGEAMGWAYESGKHIRMTYKTDGSGEVEDGGEGEVVCEIYRCEGFDWVPSNETHERSRLVCADGSIHTIPKGGRASVGLLRPSLTASTSDGFYVWG